MDCLTDLGKEAVTKLGELVVVSTIKHFKYLTQHRKITTNLEEELKNLKMMKQALQTRVNIESGKGNEIEPTVQKWLSDVIAIEDEWQKWISSENKVNKNKKCFGGQCSNLAFNYSLGKQATKNIEYITSLKEERNKFKDISYPKAQLTLGSTFTEHIKSLLSREKIITKVIEKLQDDQVKMISICGMGGVGKTTMVKEVIKIIEKSKLFHEVAMAVVSQDINYEKIQIQIAEDLGMELSKVSEKGRVKDLLQRLMTEDKKILIVLDDVWDFLNFENIGLPPQHEKYCKILLTSRDEKVCKKMGCDVNFQVSVLSEDEAWYLFREMSGKVVDRNDINPIAREVAKECGGLPLAIVTIGRALGIEGNKSAWEDALRQLNDIQSSSSSDVGKLVYPSIELSLKFLDSREHKLLLMLCGLFPEDFDIPIESLLCHGFGMGLFKDINASWEARNRVLTSVEDLRRKFLLLDSNVPGCVKMHDIVRYVVISIASKNAEDKFMKKYTFLDEINAISLTLDDTKELENGLHCPTLKLLQVSSKSKEPMFWPELFFQGMSALRVLSMKNLCIPKLPYLCQASVSLHTLQVEHCVVGDISIIGKELNHLEVLSFAHSTIKELPIEIGELDNIRLLDLTDCNELSRISEDVFIRLSRLEELYFRMDNFPWKENEVALNELKKISNQLKVLEMKFRGTEILVKDLVFNNLQKFWVYVVPYTDFQRSSYLDSTVLQVSGISYQSIDSLLMISQLFKKCEILAIRKVTDLKNVMGHDCPIPYLKDLRVDSCPDLQYLIDCSVRYNEFPQIQSLSLKNLENLKEMCYTPNHHEVKGMMIDFSYLVKLELIHLPSFIGFNNAMNFKELNQVKRMSCEAGELSMNGKLFSSDWMQQFSKLETILLENCSSINVVFDTQRYSYLDGQVFPQLKELEISHLNQLTNVWSKAMHCVQGFQNLKTLTISNCDSLRHVFTPDIIRAITNIEKLEIKSCKMMEYLVTGDEDGEEGGQINKEEVNIISFEKLDSLTLSGLPSITCFSANSYEIEFPSLRKLVIGNCPKLDTLFLPTAYTNQNNHFVASHSNLDGTGVGHFEENYPRSSNFHFGCTPLCSKLIRQSNKNNKINKAPSIPERKIKMKLGAPLLEELYVVDMFLQGMDQMRITSVPVIDGHLFPNLKSLIMKRCDKISVLLSFSSMTCLEHLEKLHILEFNDLNEIISQEGTESSGEKIVFPALQDMLLHNLPNLKAFFQGPCNVDFPSLQKVDIKDCPNMELFSRGFCSTPQLEDIRMEIESFSSSYIQKNDINATIQRFKAFVELQSSEMLNWTELIDKDMFGYFFKKGTMNITRFRSLSMLVPFSEIQILQHVRELNVSHCDSLVEVFGSVGEFTKKNDVTEFVSFQNLTKIEVYACHNLRTLLSHSMARSLVQLQRIRVEHCEMMEEIITMEGESIKGGNKVKTLFPKLEELSLSYLPKLKCFCSGDYDYDIPFEVEKEFNNNEKVQISFPQLKVLWLRKVPELKCFCSGAYDYNIMMSSIKECPNMTTFPHGNVIVSTPILDELWWDDIYIQTLGDLNLTIYYLQNSEKYKAELQKLETFRDMDEELLGYIKRGTELDIVNCHKLLNCIPSNMMQLFSHLKELRVRECECLEEIFESNDSMLEYRLFYLHLYSLPKMKHIWKIPGQILGFQNLEFIAINQCNDLKYVFPDVSIATSLPKLWRIEVSECEKIEEIIGNNCNHFESQQQKNKKIIFPSLSLIELEKLPSLKWFSQSSFPCCVEMPQCEYITIEDCPKMKTFWDEGIIYTPRLYGFYAENTEFDTDEDVNEVIQRHNK